MGNEAKAEQGGGVVTELSASQSAKAKAAKDAKEREAVSNRIGNALGGLNEFVGKMMRGCEPSWPEGRQALMGMGLMADRNTREWEARLKWLEHNWVWRLFHRSQKPRFKSEVIGGK